MTIDEVVLNWHGRPTIGVVDLDALDHNARTLQAYVGESTRMLAVVKGNAYGMGAIAIAKGVLAGGAWGVATATVDEAIQLRKAGIDAPILAMSAIGLNERGRAIGNDLRLVISDVDFARGLAEAVKASRRKAPLPVHLKIDTGMRRFGVATDEAVPAAQLITSLPELQLEGVMTHLASADEPDPASALGQVARFDEAIQAVRDAGIDPGMTHVANSAGTLRFPAFHKELVRPGLAFHGVQPSEHTPLPGQPGEMRPVFTMHSRIERIIPIHPGDAVSYGGTWIATEPTLGGLVPIGYADGYKRTLTNCGYMSVNGKRADVLGRVCMDQTVIRLPDDDSVNVGDPVVIIGDGSSWCGVAPRIEEIATIAGTIHQDFLAGIMSRVPKLYVRDGDVIAIDDLFGYREI